MITIAADEATQLAIVTPPRTVAAGQASPNLRVERRDSYGNPTFLDDVGATGSMTVTLGTSGGGKFDVNQGGPFDGTVATVTIPLSNAIADFYYKDGVAGTATITVSAGGVTSANQVIAVGSGQATQLAIVTPPRTALTGQASPKLTVERRDAFGNATVLDDGGATGSLTVTLGTSGSGEFDLNAGGAFDGTIGTVTIALGNAKADFFYRDSAPGTATITVTSGVLTSATQTMTIEAGAATQLAITTPQRTVTAGVASAVLTVERRDAYGNATVRDDAGATGSLTVTLTTSGGGDFDLSAGGSFDGTVATVTIATDNATADFYYKDEAAGTATITVSSGVLSSANQVITIAADEATQLAITIEPGNAIAGSALGVQPVVELRDIFGNTRSDDSSSTVTASVATGSGTLIGTATVTVSGGVATFTNLRLDKAENHVLEFSTDAGGFVATSTTFIVTPGPATQLVITTEPDNAAVGSAFGTQPVLELRDAFNQVITNEDGATVTAFVATGSGTLAGTATVTVSAGVATFTNLRIDKAEAHALGFSTDVGTFTVTSSTFQVAAGSATQLVFATPPRTTQAGQPTSPAIGIERQDQYGNPTELTAGGSSGSMTVTLATSSGASGGFDTVATGSFALTSVEIATGTSAVGLFYKDTLVGAPLITVSASGVAGAVQIVAIEAGSVAALDMLGPATATAGIPIATTVRAVDQYNNVATSFGGLKLLTFSGAERSANSDDPTVTDADEITCRFEEAVKAKFSSGLANSAVDADQLRVVLTASGTQTLSVSEVGAGASSGATLTVTVQSAASATHLVVMEPSADPATAGEELTVKLQALDAFGNLATGFAGTNTITFAGASAAPDGAEPKAKDNAGSGISFGNATSIVFVAGKATGVPLILKAAEIASLTAEATGAGLSAGAPLELEVEPVATATALEFASQPAQVGVNDPAEPIVVRLTDTHGNTVYSSGVAARLRLDGAEGLSGTLSKATSEDGNVTFDDLTFSQPGSDLRLIALGDLDGTTDFETSVKSNGFDVLLLARDRDPVSVSLVAPGGDTLAPKAIAVGDVDCDGVSELAISVDINGGGGAVLYNPRVAIQKNIQTPLIPDPGTVVSAVTVEIAALPGDVSTEVAHARATIRIDHTRVSDLELTLADPEATIAPPILVSGADSDGDHFVYTTFDDAAATSIQDATAAEAPFSDSYRPNEALSAFVGVSAMGPWTLTVEDKVQGYDTATGTLHLWALEIDSLEGPFKEQQAGTAARGIAISDLDQDGDGDLVIANSGDGTVSILTYDSDAYSEVRTFNVGPEPVSVAVGDFKKDGNSGGYPDIAVATSGTDAISLIFGPVLSATSAQTVQLPTDSRPTAVAIADTNNDGKLDIVGTNKWKADVTATDTLAVLFGDGTGSFGATAPGAGQAASADFVGDTPVALALGDLNLDGLIDVVVANERDASISILKRMFQRIARSAYEDNLL
ncbi:beta strand repeat-containing protein, partial [Planctomycetota bacterium]